MSTKLRILIAIAAVPLLAAPTCGQSADTTANQQLCQDAVDYLETDCGITEDGAVGSCNDRQQCGARCVLDASCDAFSATESAATQSYDSCTKACDEAGEGGSGGSSSPNCASCAEFFDGAVTYDDVCEAGQQLLDAWSACICQGVCEAACFEYCQGFDPHPGCTDCVESSCTPEIEACLSDE